MLTTLLFVAVLVAAATDWLAVAGGRKKTEYLAKPLTMLLLFAWLALAGGFGSLPLICFGLGLFFSLAGDVFLMVSYSRPSNRWFLLGLSSFFLAHVAYIVGLNIPFGEASPVWAIGIALILGLSAARLLRRIITGIRQKGLNRMVVPVAAYGTVITLMLLSALLTLYRLDWKTSASGLVCLGAVLFYASDVILAWNRYVTPVRNGRVFNMAAYHLGQVALIAGIVTQFGR